MNIGVLQADSVREEFQADHGDYPDMFGYMLKRAGLLVLGEPIDIANYNVIEGEYPRHLDECDGYIISGSRQSVYDDEPWIHRFREFLTELHAAKKKLVGICFGHQLIAEALGGKTARAKVGWGVGVHRNNIVQMKDFMQPPLANYSVIVSHQDQVTRLPAEAELLASSDFCPNSMYQIGDHILSIQGHPEFSKDYSRALIELRRGIIGETVYKRAIRSLDEEIHNRILANWIVRFIVGWH